MKFKEFKDTVKSVVRKSDYKDNCNVLELIDSDDYELFIKCLKFGSNIAPAQFIVIKLEEYSRTTPLTKDELLMMTMKLRTIDYLFNLD